MARHLHDKEAALDRMGSQELYLAMARIFADALPGSEAAIAEALKNRAWPEARRLTHSLKSNCAAMGAEALRGQASLLEKACAEADEPVATRFFPLLRKGLRDLRTELLAL